jgi:hypothetical protein
MGCRLTCCLTLARRGASSPSTSGSAMSRKSRSLTLRFCFLVPQRAVAAASWLFNLYEWLSPARGHRCLTATSSDDRTSRQLHLCRKRRIRQADNLQLRDRFPLSHVGGCDRGFLRYSVPELVRPCVRPCVGPCVGPCARPCAPPWARACAHAQGSGWHGSTLSRGFLWRLLHCRNSSILSGLRAAISVFYAIYSHCQYANVRIIMLSFPSTVPFKCPHFSIYTFLPTARPSAKGNFPKFTSQLFFFVTSARLNCSKQT